MDAKPLNTSNQVHQKKRRAESGEYQGKVVGIMVWMYWLFEMTHHVSRSSDRGVICAEVQWNLFHNWCFFLPAGAKKYQFPIKSIVQNLQQNHFKECNAAAKLCLCFKECTPLPEFPSSVSHVSAQISPQSDQSAAICYWRQYNLSDAAVSSLRSARHLVDGLVAAHLSAAGWTVTALRLLFLGPAVIKTTNDITEPGERPRSVR